MKKFIKITATLFITLLIVINTYLAKENYKSVTSLIRYQALIVQLQTYFNEINADRNKLLEDSVNEKIEATQPKEIKPSYEYLKSMTVRMVNFSDSTETKGSVGTGTIVKVTDDYTYVLTNRHVAPMDSQYLYIEKDGKRYKARVLKNGITRDLSLVRMVGKIPNTNVVNGFKKVKEQDNVYSVGMYMGFYDIYTEGTVAGWWKESRLMNMPCLNGCSGSGVFDKDGYLVAVVYAGTVYNMMGFDTAKAICVPYIGIYTFLEEIL